MSPSSWSWSSEMMISDGERRLISSVMSSLLGNSARVNSPVVWSAQAMA